MSDLGKYHHGEQETEAKGTKVIHWVIAAAVVAGLGIYVVESGFFSPQTAQTTKTYPRGL